LVLGIEDWEEKTSGKGKKAKIGADLTANNQLEFS
jgi:hypothetical protein